MQARKWVDGKFFNVEILAASTEIALRDDEIEFIRLHEETETEQLLNELRQMA